MTSSKLEVGQGKCEHKIESDSTKPIRQVLRRLPLLKREEAEKIVQGMERDGVVEPSNTLGCVC